jgi:hypothetical protein
MICSVSCGISVMFIIGMIYMDIMVYNNKTIKNYEQQLSQKLRKKYNSIRKERLKIYFQGYILGFILSLFIILYNYIYKRDKLSTVYIVCLVLATSFVTNYFYYILHPKSDWMLDNISNTNEAKTWLNMYKNMQKYYHTGMLLGLIGIGILAFAFKC